MFFKDSWRTMNCELLLGHRGHGQQQHIDGLSKKLFAFFFCQIIVCFSINFFFGLSELCHPGRFLFPFFFIPLFLFSLALHCCITWLPGRKLCWWGPLRLLPSSAEPLSDCDMILKTRCELYRCLHEQNKSLVSLKK